MLSENAAKLYRHRLPDVVLPLDWGAQVPPRLDPYAAQTGEEVLEQMRAKDWLAGNRTDPGRKIYESETGEFLVDAPRDVAGGRAYRTWPTADRNQASGYGCQVALPGPEHGLRRRH